jgi:hypothetical protein
MWQFKKIIGRGKFAAISGRKVAVKGSKRLKCGREIIPEIQKQISHKHDHNKL